MAFLVMMVASCDRKSDFITETSPFLSADVPTPVGGHDAIAERARAFAERHAMKLHYVPGHTRSSEFTISVTRDDMSIVTGNVLRGGRTLITAYSRVSPTPEQRKMVDEFMCSVFLHGCW